MKTIGLYIHYPFCRRQCFYCHFYRIPRQQQLENAYAAAACREMQLQRNPDYLVDTIYIGGGSPSLCSINNLTMMVEALQRCFRVAARPEWTIEVNPEDVTPVRLQAWQRLGINRLSLGVQSFAERDLRYLERRHTPQTAQKALKQIFSAGFANVSIDLMLGLPGQTRRNLEKSLAIVGRLPLTHLSAYLLEGVGEQEDAKKEIRQQRSYDYTRQRLAEMGFQQYEVSNFCRGKFWSKHNLKYWQNRSYLGVGPAAAGFESSLDYRNVADVNQYLALLKKNLLPRHSVERLNPQLRPLVTGLRLLSGVSAARFRTFASATNFLLGEGFLLPRGKNIAVPVEKILLLNEILGRFI